MKKPDLSIIILSYNTKDLLINCLNSLKKLNNEVNFEIIVVDNNSTDGSKKYLDDQNDIKFIENNSNLGFAAGNNSARNKCLGKYILFLNSDTEVYKNTLKESLNFIINNPKVGVVTCKMVLPNGRLDPDSKRSFPTPWVALTHFSGLDKLFPTSRIFAKYWYGYEPNDKVMDIDVAQGAFFLTRKSVLDDIGWFDEDYFLDGEDIDLSWRIKEKGYRIVYFPQVSILHVKGASKGKRVGHNKVLTTIDRKRFVATGVESMRLFYVKHLQEKYPYVVSLMVFAGIGVIKLIRSLKA